MNINRPAPISYILRVILPERGIPYSESKQWSLWEQHEMFEMLRIESEVAAVK